MSAPPADTIVATSSPAGRSLRAIVRVSGPDAVRIAEAVFEPAAALRRTPTYHSIEGAVVLGDGLRCPATAYVMLAPRSYTREDIVELHIVGSPPILAGLVEAMIAAGARPAGPGEFTRRAFLNGRIDLTQAEAVQAVIAARSEAELRVAQAQLGGSFRHAVEAFRTALVGVLAEVEASIDFVDQDIRLVDPSDVARRLRRIEDEVTALAAAEPAAPPKDGVRTALCGPPNAGKSSLLNALAGHDRVLVTPVPGTTRDTVEHRVEIDGIAFRLVDTAGVRGTDHALEAEAIERARTEAEAADLALLVLDRSRPLDDGARELWERLTRRHGAALLTVLNKSDLPRGFASTDEERLAGRGPVVCVSARTGHGLGDLRAEMARRVRSDAVDRSAHRFWIEARHRAALCRAAQSLGRARAALTRELGIEFAAADLREALDALGDIVGITTADDVLDALFARFCIGK